MIRTLFITGVTGNLGGKLVLRILEDDPDARLILLIRGESIPHAMSRLENTLKTHDPGLDLQSYSKRVKVVCGDITSNGLGLSESVLNRLTSEVTHIIHSAAATKFQLPIEYSRLINYQGTANVMTLARRVRENGNLQGVAYISTAYVCGDRGGTVYEYELPDNARFSNTYEQTKWESERLVRSLMSELPVSIFRPSIIVGDSQTGRTAAFNVLYTPLRLIYEGMITTLPCSTRVPLDVVPVDFVSDAINHIFLKSTDHIGKTYHIVAGCEKCMTVDEIVKHAVDYFNRYAATRPLRQVRFMPEILSHALLPVVSHKARRTTDFMSLYKPYISVTRLFNDTNARHVLKGTSISVPALSGYFDTILSHCLETNWGRKMRRAA